MTDPLLTVKSSAKAQVLQLKGAAERLEQREVSWLRANVRPLATGAALGLVLGFLLGHLL